MTTTKPLNSVPSTTDTPLEMEIIMDNNKGFGPAMMGVILIGFGIATMNIGDFPVIVSLLMLVGGAILAVKGGSK